MHGCADGELVHHSIGTGHADAVKSGGGCQVVDGFLRAGEEVDAGGGGIGGGGSQLTLSSLSKKIDTQFPISLLLFRTNKQIILMYGVNAGCLRLAR